MAFRLHGPANIVTRKNILKFVEDISKIFTKSYGYQDIRTMNIMWGLDDFKAPNALKERLVVNDFNFSDLDRCILNLPNRSKQLEDYLESNTTPVDCVGIDFTDEDHYGRKVSTRIINENALRRISSGETKYSSEASYCINSWKEPNCPSKFYDSFSRILTTELRCCQRLINDGDADLIFEL
jgi:hypothetical protein